MFAILSSLGTTLLFPVILFLVLGRFPLVVVCLLNAALGLMFFRYVRDAQAPRAAELKSLADAFWGVWSFIGIALLFGSLDVLSGFDLRGTIVALHRWPVLYGLVANGLLATATIRTAGAFATLFPSR